MSQMMKKLVPVFPLGLAVPVPDHQIDAAADKAAIQALWVAYETAVLESDPVTWMSLWDADGLHPQPNGPWRGSDRMLCAQSDWVETPTDAISILPKEIVVRGDCAYTIGTYAVGFVPGHGQARRVEGAFKSTLRRQDDGSWRILRNILNPGEE